MNETNFTWIYDIIYFLLFTHKPSIMKNYFTLDNSILHNAGSSVPFSEDIKVGPVMGM